ncbi:MAG: hypothetical protein ACRDY6_13710 [Acidimicrobiia bacterium]
MFSRIVITRMWDSRLGRYYTSRVRGFIHVRRKEAVRPGVIPDRSNEVHGIALDSAEAGETVRVKLQTD